MPCHSVAFNAFRGSIAETLPQLYIRIMTSRARTIFPGSGGDVCKLTCANVCAVPKWKEFFPLFSEINIAACLNVKSQL